MASQSLDVTEKREVMRAPVEGRDGARGLDAKAK